jgi:dTMP kinase
MALLFAADRHDHLDSEIVPNLNDDIVVVCDRYDFSSIVYQTMTSEEDEKDILKWISTLNSKLITPDLTIILDVASETALERRKKRGGVHELYDDDELQKKLASFYLKMPLLFRNRPIAVIDGTESVEKVHARCLDLVLK